MRKLWTFILVLVFISICFMKPNTNINLFESATVQYFLSNKVSLDLEDIKITDNGQGCIVECSSNLESVVEEKLSSYSGKTYIVEGSEEDIEEITKKFNIKIESYQSGNLLGFSEKFDKNTLVGGKLVNIQIAYRENKIYVGLPLLLGSY